MTASTSHTAYINGQAYQIQAGETILQFLRRHLGEKPVPTLCDSANLEPYGSCRICSVEVAREADGPRRTMASCHTPVSDGIHIYTHTESLLKLRRNIIELVLTDHPLDCLTCEVNGNCELQDVAAETGIRQVRYPQGANHQHYKKDLSHPYLTADLSKCINCYRCLRACDEIQGEMVLSVAGRGFDSRIIMGMDTDFLNSPCVSCGACAQACPTSAISDVYESKSIAYTKKTRTVCTYCGVGCNLEVATINGDIKSIQAPYDAAVNQGHTCLKGRYAFTFYNHPDRLRTPLKRQGDEFVPISWEEAYDLFAERLQKIKAEHGPDAIAGISSSRCTNEENYLMQKFMRAVIGTNNIDGCARVCHSPTALGMQRTFGTGAATNSINDLQHTDCILLIGANPTEAHPVTGAKIKQQVMKGKTLIVIDPRKTELARYAQHHLALRPGTNVAVLNMMMYYIIAEGLVDTTFVKNRTEGYEDFKQQILNLDIDALEAVSGVPREQVRQAAIAYATAPSAMSFHGLGVTEHYQGTFAVMQIADLAMITGNIGRRGVGVNPLRGQNNVQGAADMGVQPHQGAGYLDLTDPKVRAQYEAFYGTTLPSEIGYKIPEMFEAALQGQLKVIWIIGEDVVQTDPNSQKVIKALRQMEFVVVQELFMTETARYADLILPGASFLEKSGTFTNGERRVQRVQQVLPPVGQAKVDGQIIVDMMNRLGYPQPNYDPADLLEREISQIVPFFKGIRWHRLGNNGLQWPVDENGNDTQILHAKQFKLGKGQLWFAPFQETEELKKYHKDYPFILTTNRNLVHYNCGAMTRRTRNRLLITEDVLFIHPKDAAKYNINENDWVCLESARGKVDIRAHLSEDVQPGILSTTFHFPDILINNITSDVLDTEAACPEYKVVAVRIRKARRVKREEKLQTNET